MAPEEIQALADGDERDAMVRYRRRQRLAVLVADAIRRAEALNRLEHALSSGRRLG